VIGQVAVTQAFLPLLRQTGGRVIIVGAEREQHGRPPEVVADKVLVVLRKSRPRASYLVGKDAHLLANLVRFVPTLTLDALRRRIFHLPAPGWTAATQ
jgi:hypothetical protein